MLHVISRKHTQFLNDCVCCLLRHDVTPHPLRVCAVHSVWTQVFGTMRWQSLHREWCRLDGPPRTANSSTTYLPFVSTPPILPRFLCSCTLEHFACVCFRKGMGLEMMSTHVLMMAAGSSSGTTLAVNLTLIPAGRKVCSHSRYSAVKKFVCLGFFSFFFFFCTFVKLKQMNFNIKER